MNTLLSRNVQSRLRHKLTMAWIMNERDGSRGVPRDRMEERAQEIAYLFDAVLPIYEAKGYTAALWLDRQMKSHDSYCRAVLATPLGDAMPDKPFFSRALDEAFKVPSLRAHPATLAVFAK